MQPAYASALAALIALAGCEIGSGASVDQPDAAVTGSDGGGNADAADLTPPTPMGSITAVTAGEHDFSCDGMTTNLVVPPACVRPGCGVILQLHGDTGSGALMDAHTKLKTIAAAQNYIVISPTGPAFGQGQPGSTWRLAETAKLIATTRLVANVFRANLGKIHATGFSRGGFMNWRLLCDGSDLFASVAPAAAGDGNSFGETTCFAGGRSPTRKIPILFLIGRTDVPVPLASMQSIRDAAIANYGATGPTVVDSDANYSHNRWTGPAGAIIETYEHSYETVADGPWANARGHCFPGSTMDPYAPQYAVPCRGPNGFVWGQQVLNFFMANHR